MVVRGIPAQPTLIISVSRFAFRDYWGSLSNGRFTLLDTPALAAA